MKINGYYLGLGLISLSEYIWNSFFEPTLKFYPYSMFLCMISTIIFFGLAFKQKGEKE